MISKLTDACYSTVVLDYASRGREREKERKKGVRQREQCLFSSSKLTIKVIHTFSQSFFSFLVNSTSCKCNRIHLNELKVF